MDKPLDPEDLADLLTVARAAVRYADVLARQFYDNERINPSTRALPLPTPLGGREIKAVLVAAHRLRRHVTHLVETDILARGAALRRQHLKENRADLANQATEAAVDVLRQLREETDRDAALALPVR